MTQAESTKSSSTNPDDYGPMHAVRLIWCVMPDDVPFSAAVLVWDMVREVILPSAPYAPSAAPDLVEAQAEGLRAALLERLQHAYDKGWEPAARGGEDRANAHIAGMRSVVAALTPSTPQPEQELREALEGALAVVVGCIAFNGRDGGTDRLQSSMDGLTAVALREEPKIRAALLKALAEVEGERS